MIDANQLDDQLSAESDDQATAVPEADGYYGDEDLEDGELDLSFLDEDDADEPAAPDKPSQNK